MKGDTRSLDHGSSGSGKLKRDYDSLAHVHGLIPVLYKMLTELGIPRGGTGRGEARV